MDVSIEAKRRAYAVWLRTGRWPVPQGADGTELKFNPWHDPKDGRFTTAGGAASGGQIGSAPARTTVKTNLPSRTRDQRIIKPQNRQNTVISTLQAVVTAKHDLEEGFKDGIYDTAMGAAKAVQSTLTTKPVTTIKNNNFAIADQIDGVIAAEDTPARKQIARAANRVMHTNPHEIGYVVGKVAGNAAITSATGAVAGKLLSLPLPVPTAKIVVNGHRFHIDAAGRPKLWRSELSLDRPTNRSSKVQVRAGGSDRRITDQGGHLIAPRFGGPANDFNHIAQDANFNQGIYRKLEDKWAKAIKNNQKVVVETKLKCKGPTQRPDRLIVRYKIDNRRYIEKFHNEKGGVRDAR
jgi:hypothetical protein